MLQTWIIYSGTFLGSSLWVFVCRGSSRGLHVTSSKLKLLLKTTKTDFNRLTDVGTKLLPEKKERDWATCNHWLLKPVTLPTTTSLSHRNQHWTLVLTCIKLYSLMQRNLYDRGNSTSTLVLYVVLESWIYRKGMNKNWMTWNSNFKISQKTTILKSLILLFNIA